MNMDMDRRTDYKDFNHNVPMKPPFTHQVEILNIYDVFIHFSRRSVYGEAQNQP